MNIDAVAPAQSNQFSVKVSEGMEDQQERVVKTLISSIEGSSAGSRSGFATGQLLDIQA